MKILIHPPARQRMLERGATAAQVKLTVARGSPTPAKFGRTRFRLAMNFGGIWNGKHYARKQIDAFAAKIKGGGWLVVTIIVKYF
jgi:hypothetical protein